LAFGLISTGLGGGGYLKATTIMSLEQILLEQQFPACDFRPENTFVLISHFADSLCIMLS